MWRNRCDDALGCAQSLSIGERDADGLAGPIDIDPLNIGVAHDAAALIGDQPLEGCEQIIGPAFDDGQPAASMAKPMTRVISAE